MGGRGSGGAGAARGGGGGGKTVIEETLSSKDLKSSAKDRSGQSVGYNDATQEVANKIASRVNTGDRIHVEKTMRDGTVQSETIQVNSNSMDVVSSSLRASYMGSPWVGTNNDGFRRVLSSDLAFTIGAQRSKIKSVRVFVTRGK